MPSVQLQRKEQILQRIIARIVARANLTDLNDSSVAKHIAAGVAREIDDSNFQLTRLQDLFSIDLAVDEDLDERAREIQPGSLQRILAQRAIGFLVFSRGTNTGTTVNVPIGTIVKTADGIAVRTTQLGTITSTSAEQISGHGVGRDSNVIAAVAVEEGSRGNIATNTAVKFASKPPGIDAVTNVSAFVQGRDRESNESFRARIKNFVASLARGTVDALKFAALGVTDANGRTVIYAHVSEDMAQLGNVTLYIDDGAGTAGQLLSVAPSGTGGSVSAPAANIQTFTKGSSGDPFRAELVGRTITIADAVNGTNNGTFTILTVLGNNQVTFTNAAGVVESLPATATWAISGENITAGLLGPPANSAVGGEEYLSLDHSPVRLESVVTLVSSTRGTLVLGTDYLLNPASGVVKFLTPLSAAEVITASYSYFIGLVQAVQKIIDGDPDDRLNYPGVRAAGTLVRVMPPVVLPQTVIATLTLARNVDAATVFAAVETAVSSYINGLGIGGDVVRNEIIERIMAVPSVLDVNLVFPTSNATMLDNQIPRITSADIDLT